MTQYYDCEVINLVKAYYTNKAIEASSFGEASLYQTRKNLPAISNESGR